MPSYDAALLAVITNPAWRATRVAPYLQPEGDCLIWQRAINGSGYGVIRVRVSPTRSEVYNLHRLIWMASHRKLVPAGHDIDHTCSVGACAEESHLQPVQHAENSRLLFSRRRADATVGIGALRLASSASVRVRYNAAGMARYQVLFRDYVNDCEVQRSRTLPTRDDADAFIASLPDRTGADLFSRS